MGWSHPDISIEEFLDRIKGFVDILILASGYQSSGLPAIWDVDNIKKAIRWGIFFEDVLKSLRSYGNYEESVMELDEALSRLVSDPNFPLGLAHFSSATLSNARRLVLEHFLHTHPIKDEYFVAFLRAVVEMDIEQLSESHNDSPKAYIDRLTLQVESLDLEAVETGLAQEDKTPSPENNSIASNCSKHIDQNFHTPVRSNGENKEFICVDNSSFVIKEILQRRAVMSRVSSVEKGLTCLSDIITRNNLIASEDTRKPADVSSNEDQMVAELYQFSHWRSRCLSYLLDKRTIKLLSGSQLILNASKEQWVRVFEGLRTSSKNLLEIMEILLLGLISSTWNYLIQQLTSLPCDFLSVSKKISELHELAQENCSPLHSRKKEKEILEYLTSLLGSQSYMIWKLPSILVAAAIPSWSALFRTHLREVENHYNESYSLIRCHWCCQHGNEHQNCQVAERIQSLYTIHIHLRAELNQSA